MQYEKLIHRKCVLHQTASSCIVPMHSNLKTCVVTTACELIYQLKTDNLVGLPGNKDLMKLFH